jgi:hypothetical protein
MPAAMHLHPAVVALLIVVGIPAAVVGLLLLGYYVLPGLKRRRQRWS